MLRKFKIKLNGEEYLVEMEEIGGGSVPVSAPTESVAPAPSQPAPAPKPDEETTSASEGDSQPPVTPASQASGEAMEAPMPGTILKIFVEPGEQVAENQPLLILEAMKMENQIVASTSGTVTGIHVKEGQAVDAGAPLITIG